MELQPFLSILGRYKSHRISAGPFAAWYNWKESHPGQFYLLYRAALFVCPGSDTFLMNYTIFLHPEIYFLLTIFLIKQQTPGAAAAAPKRLI